MDYDQYCKYLKKNPKKWLITGVAGFIGSNLLDRLLTLDQCVVGLDNFETGFEENLSSIKYSCSNEAWNRFTLIDGDICDLKTCLNACEGVDIVLHQAALGSVPRSIENPIRTNEVNINGFVNILFASKESDIERLIFAASSSTYGDHPDLPKVEEKIGKPLSPYAVTKYVNELYADIFNKTYGLNYIGLRYFNVFGPRQNPEGAYAAVIPKWINAMMQNKEIIIYGDGKTSRDFCYIENVIQANILASLSTNKDAINQIYNIAVGDTNNLNDLHDLIVTNLEFNNIFYKTPPTYLDFREGDVKHSLANIDKAKTFLGYDPKFALNEGLKKSIPWFKDQLKSKL